MCKIPNFSQFKIKGTSLNQTKEQGCLIFFVQFARVEAVCPAQGGHFGSGETESAVRDQSLVLYQVVNGKRLATVEMAGPRLRRFIVVSQSFAGVTADAKHRCTFKTLFSCSGEIERGGITEVVF